MREYQYIVNPETLKLEIRHRQAFLLDQTTPQSVVPLAGTTFGLTTYDALPNFAPDAFVVPAIAFTNSNIAGFNPYIGAIRGGVLGYAYDGNNALIGLVEDLEADQLAIFEYEPSDSTLRLGLNSSGAEFVFGVAENSTGSFFPVLGGRDSDGSGGLFFDTLLGLWDSQGSGNVAIVGVSQDFSVTSFILVWNSVTEQLSYSGEGGMVINTTGWTEGTTSTPLSLSFQSIGDGHDNDGLRLEFKHRSDAGVLGTAYTAGYIDCIQTDASATTMDSYLAIGGYTAGASAEWLRLTGLLGTFNTDLKVVTGTNTYLETDELTLDLDALVPDLEITIPIMKGTSHSTLPETLPFPYAVGIYDRLVVFTQDTFDQPEILFAYPDFSASGSIGADLTNGYLWANWDFNPQEDDTYNLGASDLRWQYGYFSDGVYVDTGLFSFANDRMYLTNVATARAIDRTSDVATSTVTVTNTTTETTVFTGSLPAGSLRAGNILKFNASGDITNASAADIVTIRIKVGGVEFASIQSPGSALSDDCWHIIGLVTIRSIGATGSMAWHVDMDVAGTSDDDCDVDTIDTTSAEDITVTAQWNNAKSGNVFTLTQGFMEYKN